MINRCLVCGLEEPRDHEASLGKWTDSGNGNLRHGQSIDLFLCADGAVAVACEDHTDDERRAAFVLAERTLRLVPTRDKVLA